MSWAIKENDKELEPENNNGKCLREYNKFREKYLSLCRRYGLNPFDLDILSLSVSRLPKGDKIRIISLMLKLIKLERMFKNTIENGLFPLTVLECERSGYLVPSRVK